MWQSIVTEYSTRLLTEASDKLPALAGIAQKFHELTGDQYLAGIWKESLLDHLLWRHESIEGHGPIFRHFNRSETFGKPAKYRAPSWSWAAINGPVRWPLATSNRAGEYYAKLMDYKVTPRTHNIFGEVIDGYITLQAPLWEIPRDIAHSLLAHNVIANGRNSSHWYHYATMDWGDEAAEAARQNRSGISEHRARILVEHCELFLLMIYKNKNMLAGMILELDKVRKKPNCYKRAGVCVPSRFSIHFSSRGVY